MVEFLFHVKREEREDSRELGWRVTVEYRPSEDKASFWQPVRLDALGMAFGWANAVCARENARGGFDRE